MQEIAYRRLDYDRLVLKLERSWCMRSSHAIHALAAGKDAAEDQAFGNAELVQFWFCIVHLFFTSFRLI
jgi:hypothetical protein